MIGNDWWEMTTYSNDYSRIEFRRLSPDEVEQAVQAQREYFWGLIASMFSPVQEAVSATLLQLDTLADEFKAVSPTPEQRKAEARRRSREDVRQKRRDMMRQRGRGKRC